MASTVPSVRVLKTIPFKGGSRTYSNRYHFDGGTPSDQTHWHTLMDNIVTAEKAIFHGNTTIVEVYGYAPGSEVSVSEKAYTTVGTMNPSGTGVYTPGEVAALVRYSTAARSTKNHPVYLFNYYHDAFGGNTKAIVDLLDATQKTAMQTYAAAWITGFSDGTVTHHRAGPQGELATGSVVEEYLTHRDFPYTRSL